MRGALVCVLFAGWIAATAHGNAQTAAPGTYDVSTVRPAPPGQNFMRLNWNGSQLKADNVMIEWMLMSAFHARKDQISGEPDWAGSQRYDITAKLVEADTAAVDKLSQDQHRALLLALLVERFGLKYHVETKEMATYDLQPSKKGLKLTPAADSGDKSKKVYDMCSGCTMWGNNGVTGHDISVTTLAEFLATQLERTVNDHTSYEGKIDVKIKWAPDLGTKPASDDDASLPPLPQALEEGLGLHLQPSHGPVKIYVIDHLDKPSDN